MDEKSFTVLYLKQHALRAYFAINASAKELPLLQRLIRTKKDVIGQEARLQDPAVPLKSFL
jgi:hypothetical protein